MFLLAKIYGYGYGLAKDAFAINLKGFGVLLRSISRDRVIVVQGIKWWLSHELSGSYGRLVCGQWNEPETHSFLQRVYSSTSRDLCFVDVGAHIGEFVIGALSHSNVRRIVAFEPIEACCEVISRSIGLNDVDAQIDVVTQAVWEASGQVRFISCRDALLSSSVVDQRDSGDSVGISVTSLDDYFRDADSRHYVVLIDVEGFELEVLRGASRLLQQCQPLVIFEFNRRSKKRYGLQDIRDALPKSYVVFRLRRDGKLDHDFSHTWNCVAVSQESPFFGICHSMAVSDS